MKFWKHKDERPLVQVVDLDTGQITQMPAAELAPGMIRVTFDDREGEYWVEAGKLNPSPYRHPPFDEPVRNRLRHLQETLQEVYPLPLEEWEDGFRRDANAEHEIAMWLYLAKTYRDVLDDRAVSLSYKQDLFHVLLSCLNNPREQILTVVDLQAMSRAEAEAVIRAFYQET
jgi:hypothetical protein